MIDINAPVEVVTNSGQVCKARIVCSDVKDNYSIVAVFDAGKFEYVSQFRTDGISCDEGLTLRNVNIQREGWLLVSVHNQWAEAPYGTIYKSRKEALTEGNNRLTVAKIQWEE